jgi:class 3 adenylate cyclase
MFVTQLEAGNMRDRTLIDHKVIYQVALLSYPPCFTLFFSDIVDFSAHSGKMEGEALSAILNSYLEEMTKIINAYGRTLDKYIGDAILVFFGDPDFIDDYDHAWRCVKIALAMRKRMAELQDDWFRLGYSDPLHTRMGISTGYVSAGNFGSSEYMTYTIIGTPVNLASRLQTAAMADQILIAHDTWGLVKDRFACSDALKLELKGFNTPC